jgi:hypothetical protein
VRSLPRGSGSPPRERGVDRAPSRDVTPITPVPVLETWAMALMAMLLAGFSVSRLRRRRI